MASSSFHTGVNLAGIHFEAFALTVALAAGITKADEGKAVTKDGTVANGYKLAGDGDSIEGRLAVVETRTIEGTLLGTVEFVFANNLPVKSGQTVVVGDRVIGAGAGEVKASTLAALSTADATAPGATYNQVDTATIATLANALKVRVNLMLAMGHRNIVVAKPSSLVATVLSF